MQHSNKLGVERRQRMVVSMKLNVLIRCFGRVEK